MKIKGLGITCLMLAVSQAACSDENTDRIVAALEKATERMTVISEENLALQKKLQALETKLVPGLEVPSGLVVASTLACNELGDDWSEFAVGAGKFIVGVGQRTSFKAKECDSCPESEEETPLTERRYGAVGGEETHTLTIEEMPRHRHPISTSWNRPVENALAGHDKSKYGIDSTYSDSNEGASKQGGGFGPFRKAIGPTGGGVDGSPQSHNNMSPFIALHWCKKD